MTFEYDDRKLRELFGEMDEKHRLKALKGAFRAEGNKVKKIAVGNLRSKMRSNRKLETCIRVVVSKKKPQFTVTASPKGRATRSGKNGSPSWSGRRTERSRGTRDAPPGTAADGSPVLIPCQERG